MIDPRDVSDLRERLRFMHQFLSWRQIANEFYPGVKFGTLQRIAGEDYLPTDRKILRALGLVEGRRPRTAMEKAISDLVRDTNNSVMRRKPSKKEYLAVEVKK